MDDLEREQLRKTYQICRIGFGFTAAALVLATFASLVNVVGMFQPRLVMAISERFWYQFLDTPIVWFSLIGATLLWGRWNETSWQRRSGLLLVMSMVDVGLWFVASGEILGARAGEMGHRWLRVHLGEALGWAEFALLSSMAAGYLVHLGVEQARESDRSTRSLAASGAMLWMLLFCQRTHWGAGWPLQPRRFNMFEGFLLYHGFHLIWAITVIQVTAMVISAVQHTNRVLGEMDQEDSADDLFRSPSEMVLDPANREYAASDPFASR